MFAVNIELHVPGRKGAVFGYTFDVDEHSVAEMRERAQVLAEDPLRCQSWPQMTLAGWDLLERIMVAKAAEYPQRFELTRDGTGSTGNWGSDQHFTVLDESGLPCGPLEFITRQTQADFPLQNQREDNLWMNAGMVTTQADWSLDFDIGMHFFEWHAPVPLTHEKCIFSGH